MARHVPERFLVAFSLAGEQRELVRSVAAEVERQLGESTVFFDEWYEFYIAGRDADLKLQRIYGSQCELAVICISSNYGSKPWTRAEHEAVRARYMAESGSPLNRDRVLALRFGDGEVEGIHLNYIVPDVRNKNPADVAELIISRLHLVSPPRIVAGSAGIDWPRQLPQFRWPLADHADAQAAFRSLLVNESTSRLLPIVGESETGKSSLARQMERKVTELLPDLQCGRFDFKGTTGRRVEVEALARSLDLVVPSSRSGNDQLRGLLSQLLRLPKPTLLIFDTYEDSGDAQAWIERVFLPDLLRTKLLRVVVLGRQVPVVHEGAWGLIAAPTVRLQLPDAEAWFEYGRRVRPEDDFDLDFVTKVHRMSRGSPTALNVVFGPRTLM